MSDDELIEVMRQAWLDAPFYEGELMLDSDLRAMRAVLDVVRAHDRDGELLDWLERNPRHESAPYFDDEAGAWGFPYEVSNAGGHGGGVGFRHFGSLRAAIGAAMRAEG